MSAVLPNFTSKLIDAGRLELLNPVGTGTCGTVYLAIDHHASTPSHPARRAIKVVQKAGPSARDTQHQQREFRIQALVSDVPSVHKLLEVYEDEGYFYLISDYRDCDLFDLIKEGIVFDHNDEHIRSAFVQVLDAVHGCHRKKVYHRDLKPENILCTADGEKVYLADFGSATPMAKSYLRDRGTDCYLSPECVDHETSSGPYWTKYADIWALGVILFNLISGGRRPWKEATLDDPAFKRFLEDENYLESKFGISIGAASLLKRIFSTNPITRPSIACIRSNVLRLETFFADFEQDSTDESDDGSEFGSVVSEDVPQPIDVLGQKRPLPRRMSPSEDDFARGLTAALEKMDPRSLAILAREEDRLEGCIPGVYGGGRRRTWWQKAPCVIGHR
ncbi:kinase-like domain-containing protein [Fomitopsis betulina]|nr:kinase-like domain-containing protein [Fomitopsis betulina]